MSAAEQKGANKYSNKPLPKEKIIRHSIRESQKPKHK